MATTEGGPSRKRLPVYLQLYSEDPHAVLIAAAKAMFLKIHTAY